MTTLALVYAAWSCVCLAVLCVRMTPLWVRAVVVCCALPIAFGVWRAAQPPSGWPATSSPPAGSTFVAASVEQPRWVFLWLVPPGADRPRSYRLPYSPALERQVLMAGRLARAGIRTRLVTFVRPGRQTSSREHNRYRFTVTPTAKEPR